MSDETGSKADLGGTVIRGCVSAIFTMLLFGAAALLLPKSELLQNHTAAAGKGILLLGAFLCGTLCGKNAVKQRLLHAELGGAILLIAVLLMGAIIGTDMELTSVVIDILLTAFGSFASMLLSPGRKSGTGKKRKYRK